MPWGRTKVESRDLLDEIEGFLADTGYQDVQRGDDVLSFQAGSALVLVSVVQSDYGPVVLIRSPLAFQVGPYPEMIRDLALRNGRLIFGRLHYDPEDEDAISGTVMLDHSLLATTMDVPELDLAVRLVANMADDLDDEIVNTYGGVRAID